ncbi:MAG TPA: CPBP family intramembrane glutamic endopeptidase [Caulobacteraceae bacterium]|jgi:membrane protease YdiL (CAAX protease family)
MPLLPAVLLVISLAAIAWLTWRDIGEYEKFKRLTDTRDRQARYRRWVLGAFALFVGGSLAILAILGKLGCVIHPPKAFFGVMRWAQAQGPSDAGALLLGGMTAGAATSIVVISVVAAIVSRRRGAALKTRTLGDIAPLMPRNWPETAWTALLSINAGVGEELFFRLTLPLLIALVTGSAPAAFAAAAVVFGLVHIYQGWIGVLATMLLGVVFTGVYLVTGSIFWPIALHAAFDLLGLVVRPTFVRLAQARRA